MSTQTGLKKVRASVMNAVHDLPVLVARDQGYFMDEGLDIDFVTTPGMAQVTSSHTATWDNIFERPLDTTYDEGGIDQYRMCEWGIVKRAVECTNEGLRPRKIVALGAAMSSFAIVVDDSQVAQAGVFQVGLLFGLFLFGFIELGRLPGIHRLASLGFLDLLVPVLGLFQLEAVSPCA